MFPKVPHVFDWFPTDFCRLFPISSHFFRPDACRVISASFQRITGCSMSFFLAVAYMAYGWHVTTFTGRMTKQAKELFEWFWKLCFDSKDSEGKNMLHEQTLLWQRKREGNVKRLWVVELVLSCCHVQSNISTSRPGPKVDRLFANSHELSENATIHTALWHVLGLRSCPATRLNKRSQSWVSSAFLPSIPCSLKAKWFLLVRSCASMQLHFWRFLRNVHLAQTKKRISSNIIEHP